MGWPTACHVAPAQGRDATQACRGGGALFFKLGGGQNGSLTGSGSSGVSLPQQPPILHASSDSVVAASPTSSLMELSGSGAGAVDMWWMQARWM